MRTAASSYISVTKETTEKLVKVFNCTPQMVMNALTYRSSSELARKIRFTAVHNYGGKAWRHCPECETWYDVSEEGRDLMRQLYDNGVRLDVDKRTGEAVMYDRRGNVIERSRIVGIEKLTDLQLKAESL